MKRFLLLLFVLPLLACMTSVAAVQPTVKAASTLISAPKAQHDERTRASEPTPQALCARVIAVESLWIRSEPRYGSVIVGDLGHGAAVDVLEDGGGWWKVRSGDVEGFVRASFLQIVECGQ